MEEKSEIFSPIPRENMIYASAIGSTTLMIKFPSSDSLGPPSSDSLGSV